MEPRKWTTTDRPVKSQYKNHASGREQRVRRKRRREGERENTRPVPHLACGVAGSALRSQSDHEKISLYGLLGSSITFLTCYCLMIKSEVCLTTNLTYPKLRPWGPITTVPSQPHAKVALLAGMCIFWQDKSAKDIQSFLRMCILRFTVQSFLCFRALITLGGQTVGDNESQHPHSPKRFYLLCSANSRLHRICPAQLSEEVEYPQDCLSMTENPTQPLLPLLTGVCTESILCLTTLPEGMTSPARTLLDRGKDRNFIVLLCPHDQLNDHFTNDSTYL